MKQRYNPRVITALDLPVDSPGGSVELFLDLYSGLNPLIPAQACMLAAHNHDAAVPANLKLLQVGGKCLDGRAFKAYVATLRQALTTTLNATEADVVHLQHLTFGATPALLQALPTHPHIALVHGTDLLFAAAHATQLRTLRETVHAVKAIVVPTGAMADKLSTLCSSAKQAKIIHIPWGVPDKLLAAASKRPPRPPSEQFHLLYAGRLTAEKGVQALAYAVARTPGVQLSIAAPAAQFNEAGPIFRSAGVRPSYLGWLRRPQLWEVFGEYDALAVPSTTFEAFGLSAVEAQACGLPVLYQPVPGLNEVLAGSALATDFADASSLARSVRRLCSEPGLLPSLRTAGFSNANHYSLNATAAALVDLGKQLN